MQKSRRTTLTTDLAVENLASGVHGANGPSSGNRPARNGSVARRAYQRPLLHFVKRQDMVAWPPTSS
jgi:hypothetical protein